MVGIVSGSGVGLFNSSLDVLGLTLGQAGFGQASGSSYVNVATGNLTVQFLDETLSGSGADMFALRTYNSKGALTDGDLDGWRWSGEKKLVLSGTRNAAGSTVTRTTGDGKTTTFTWDGSKYISKDGSGAHDILTWNSAASEWQFREDGGSTIERYNGSTGWIKSLRDSSGNGFDYTFSGDKLTKIVDLITGQTIEFTYNANGLVDKVQTRNSATGAAVTQVRYTYDSSKRLTSVITDLTPDNTSDSLVYTTNYTYHSTSRRIATISQSDGTSVSFTYDASERIATVTDQGGTTTFTYGTGTTSVQNGEGNVWTYTYDSAQRLTKVSSQAVGGVTQSTTYTYDANGNVQTIVDGKNKTTTFTYDANGNRTKEVDSLGNTVSRTFSSDNLVTTETRYSIPSTSTPGGAETVRYVYDSAKRLRFTVSAEGRVSELRYTSLGLVSHSIQYPAKQYSVAGIAVTATLSESQLTTWLSGLTATEKSQAQITAYSYDTRGNLAKKIDYAAATTAGQGSLTNAADVTFYTYSAHGQLLQTIVARGSNRDDAAGKTTLTSTVYDGLGRVISQVNAGATTTTTYSGVTTTVTNTATGLSVVSTTDSRGRVISVNGSGANVTNRLTKYVYDQAGRLRMTEDPTGARSYLFYDAAGRVSAKVDPTGAAIVYTYDANGRALTETAHVNRANTSSWYNGTSVTVSSLTVATSGTPHILANSSADRKTTYTYDDAGRLSTTAVTGGLATVTNAYDGASRLVSTTQGSRVTRYYYDKDGRQLGSLDAEKGLVENVYDGAGRLIRTVRYGTPVTAVSDFATMKAAVGSGSTLTSFFYYDGEGRLVGTVNELGFLSETVYYAVGNKRETIQYMTAVSATASSTLATLKAAAGTIKRTTTTYYDAYGRVDRVVGHDSTQTRHIYDTAGRVVRTIEAEGTTDQRATRIQYNAFSEVTGAVGGVGDATLGSSPTAAQITTAITNYGNRYQYDGAGRKITELGAAAQSGSPQAKTFLFYNAAGQLTYTVNALGEVAKMTYNAFGQIENIRTYVNRISSTNLATISQGGSESLITGKLPTADNTNDVIIDTTYNQLGLVATQKDGEGYITTNTYDTYGQLGNVVRTISSGVTTKTLMQYDLLGRVKETYQDHGGLAAQTSVRYDGFGRVSQTIDANRNTTNTTYANNGRIITVTGTQNRSTKTEIDAFGRTLKSYDSYNNVTTYAYDDVNRKTTVTTAEGVTLITSRTRTGETLQVQDSKGNLTKYAYNKNGALVTVTDANNNVTTNSYYNNGQLYRTSDANNVITEFVYDAANRVVAKVVDVGGLNLRTEYIFDALGRQIKVVEGANVAAESVTTEYKFDRNGQVKQIIVDPAGLKLATTFTYDGLGQTVKVAKGTVGSPNQQETLYVFDKLGRKIEERVDPNGLNLRTQYKYDKNGNLTRVIDPRGNSTWFIYNNANQQTHTIDALGGVTLTEYDKNGRAYHTRQYATALTSVATLGNVVTSISLPAAKSTDRRTYSVYDKDGRLAYSLSAKDANNWVVSETRYDANGNVEKLIAYAATLTEAQITSMTGSSSTGGVLISPAELSTFASSNISSARVTTYEYDKLNRQTKTILPGWYDPSTGKVEAASGTGRFQRTVEVIYDKVGNAVTNKIRVGSNNYIYQYKVYDKAGRETFDIDALGYVTGKTYDAAGNLKRITRYGSAVAAPSGNYYTTFSAPSGGSRTITYAYDKAGRQTSVTQANGGVTSYQYNATGNVIKQTQKLTSSENADTFFYYDKAGRQVLTVDALKYGTKTEYDAAGNVFRVTEYAAPSTTATISTSSQPAFSTTNVKNRITEYAYDAAGRATTTKRALFDNINLPSLVTVDTKAYNVFGEVWTTKDAQDNVTSVEYDRLGQAVTLTEPVRQVAGTGVDVFKNSINASPITTFTYDAFGQVTQEQRSASAGTSATQIVNHQYDFAGNEVRTQDALGYWTDYQYDVSGKVAKQIQVITVVGTTSDTDYNHTIERRFEYDKAGRQIAALEVFNNSTQLAGQVSVYNGFGEVVEERKIWGAKTASTASLMASATNNVMVATYNYHANGNLNYKRTSEGYVYFVFDLAGRVTKTTQQAGLTSNVATDRVTESVYDKLGRVITQKLPAFKATTAFGSTSTASVTPTINRTYDRWGNVLSESGDTVARTMTYNQDNQVLTEVGPTVAMEVTATTTASTALTRTFTYDNLGRLQKETQTAYNGTGTSSRVVATNTYNNAGQLIKSIDATPVVTQENIYDVHGNKVGSRDGIGHVTVYKYNLNNQLIEQSLLRSGGGEYTGNQASPTAMIQASYKYDQAGRRYAEGDAFNNYLYYKFDERDNIVVERNRVGGLKLYEYDELGNKTAEKLRYLKTWYSPSTGYGSPVLNSQLITDTLRSWSYKGDTGVNTAGGDFVDYASNLMRSQQIGAEAAQTYKYVYDGFGQLEKEIQGTTVRVTYSYWENGLKKSIAESGAKVGHSTFNNQSSFFYDVRGNKTVELNSTSITTASHTQYYGGTSTTVPGGTSNTGNNYDYFEYDAANRLISFKAPSSTMQIGGTGYSTYNLQSLVYKYDEWGNRRRISSTSPDGGNINYTYSYDTMGRMLTEHSNGALKQQIEYNGMGQRAKEFVTNVTAYHYKTVYGGSSVLLGTSQVRTDRIYVYNDLGLVSQTNTSKISQGYENWTSGLTEEIHTYDNRGFKLVTQSQAQNRVITNTYNADGSLLTQQTKFYSGAWANRKIFDLTYTYNASGDIGSYVYRSYDTSNATNAANFRNTYTYSYINTYAGRQVKEIAVNSSQSGTATGVTVNDYDTRGRLSATRITESHISNSSQTGFSYRNFSYNANGQIIAKAEKRFGDSAYKTQRYYYSPTGGELGSFGAFGNNARPIDAVISGGSTPSTYTVNGGDTLMGIAATLWGDSKLWYLIADANGLNMGPTDAFSAGDVGRNLRIPNTDKVVGNTSSNWKPYNPNEKIGDLTPNPSVLPPPKKKGCGVVAAIIMVAIAVVLTVVTAGAAAAAMGATVASTGTAATMGTVWAAGSAALTGGLAGTAIGGVAAGMAAAAVGGFVGSVGSQLAGKAMGVVDSFSLRQAVGSGLTAGFTAGVGSYLQGGSTLAKGLNEAGKGYANMARGAASYIGAYSSNKIAGLETSFNWTDMAVASVSAGITSKTGDVSDIGKSAGEFGRNFVGNMWGSTVSSSLSRLMGRGQKQDWGAMAVDAFGNALGQAVVDHYSKPAEFRALSKKQQARVRGLAERAGADISDPESLRILMRAAETSSGKDFNESELLDRTGDYLKLSGATDDEVNQVLDMYMDHNLTGTATVTVGPLLDARTGLELAPGSGNDSRFGSAFGSQYVDEGLIGAGAILEKIASTVGDNPILGYALIGLDVAAGPVAFAAREAISRSPIGSAYNAATEKVAGYAADKLAEVGREAPSAQRGGAGAVGLIEILVGGAAAGLAKAARAFKSFRKHKIELDNKFGEVRQPYGGVKEFEHVNGKIISNPELQILSEGKKADPLEKGKKYIWAIDKNGSLRIGVETEVAPGQNLGHPSLVGKDGARVGGEIKLNGETKEWRINDRSGRYSRGRTQDERSAILNNVQKLFNEAGLDVGVKI